MGPREGIQVMSLGSKTLTSEPVNFIFIPPDTALQRAKKKKECTMYENFQVCGAWLWFQLLQRLKQEATRSGALFPAQHHLRARGSEPGSPYSVACFQEKRKKPVFQGLCT